MLDFVINNYWIFIIIAVVLLLGLFGYMIDKKKIEEYTKGGIDNNNIPTVNNVEPIQPVSTVQPAPAEAPVEEVKNTPVVDTPAVDAPVVETPAVEAPAVDVPVAETPAVDENAPIQSVFEPINTVDVTDTSNIMPN